MTITKSIEISLSVKEVEDIIAAHLLAKKEIKVDSMYFKIDSVYDDSDWRGEFPPTHEFAGVVCSGKID